MFHLYMLELLTVENPETNTTNPKGIRFIPSQHGRLIGGVSKGGAQRCVWGVSFCGYPYLDLLKN